jgi:hypothetical protein
MSDPLPTVKSKRMTLAQISWRDIAIPLTIPNSDPGRHVHWPKRVTPQK